MTRLWAMTTAMKERTTLAWRIYNGEDADGLRITLFDDVPYPVWVLSYRGDIVRIHPERRVIEEAATPYRRRREDQDGTSA